VEKRARVGEQVGGLALGAKDFGGDAEGIEGGIFLEESAVEAVNGMGAEVSAVAHGAEEAAHFIPRAGTFGVVEAALAFLDENLAQQGGRITEDAPHIFAEEDENAAVKETLGEADELATRAGEIGIGFDEGAIDELAVVVIFPIEILLNGFFADHLVAQQAVEHGCATFRQQHVRPEHAPEDEATEGGRRRVGEEARFGDAAGLG